jgi:signal transduction histidine kinase
MLGQQVSVRSKDEMGELAASFNQMSADLARSTDARKQMTADIAHELRTPLSLILGHAEAVHDGVLPPTRENFEIIREEAFRLEHLVDDLRILSLADAGELSINLQEVPPQKLLKDVQATYQHIARQRDVKIKVDVASDIPMLSIDPVRMTQVLTNVLDNALHHTPEGGQVNLSAQKVQGGVELAIQDSGPGIEGNDVNRIFERFYRTDSARHRDEGGSGLGLAIAKSIVQAHNGQIWAESAPGQGLKILIRFPVSF